MSDFASDNLTSSIITSEHSLAGVSLAGQKALSLDAAVSRWLGGRLEGQTPARPTRPYAQNEWVYACIEAIMTAAGSIQLMLSTATDEIVESGPQYDALFRNPAMSFEKFLTETVGFYALDRTVYWLFDRPTNPTQVLVVGKRQLKPVVRRGVLAGWYLLHEDGAQEAVLLDEVYPIAGFNPYAISPLAGVGPADVAKLAISSAYQAALLNESALANGGKLGPLITVPGSMTEDEKRFIISQFEARHGGPGNAGRPVLATGGADVKTMAQTMADLQMLEMRQFDGRVIAMVQGVPPEVIGMASEAQYSHGPAQQRFIANCVAPLLTAIAGHITMGLLPRFTAKAQGLALKEARTYAGRASSLKARPDFRQAKRKALAAGRELYAWFAVEDHPAMQALRREIAKEAVELLKAGLTLNSIIDANDLPYEHVAWGDEWWIPMGQVPARYILEGGIEAVTGGSLPEGDGEETPPEKNLHHEDTKEEEESEKAYHAKAALLWQKYAASWQPIERDYVAFLRLFFVKQGTQLKHKLRAAWQANPPAPQRDLKAGDELIQRVVFDLRIEDGKLKLINRTFFERAAKLGIRQALTEAGQAETAVETTTPALERSAGVRRKLLISSERVAGVNQTTRAAVARTLREGLAGGEDLQKLTTRIDGVLGETRARALRIARTQTAGAISTGRHEGFKAAGLKGKAWITSGDDHVRATHKQAGAQYRQGIAADQPFIVGGASLMYPGDPSGPAAEIVNCRCLEIARAIAEADGKEFAFLGER